MERPEEICSTCGGDRRIGNSFGLTTTCPSCHGSGRRAESTGFHDVTKTKPSHHRQTNRVDAVAKVTWPVTGAGAGLAKEITDSPTCTAAQREALIGEIIQYEVSHGQCTQTFMKKIRKQFRPRPTT